jgi:hypothetical protein
LCLKMPADPQHNEPKGALRGLHKRALELPGQQACGADGTHRWAAMQ